MAELILSNTTEQQQIAKKRAELKELEARLLELEPELATLRTASVASADRTQATQTAVIAALNAAAERIENITKRLNETVTESGVPMG